MATGPAGLRQAGGGVHLDLPQRAQRVQREKKNGDFFLKQYLYSLCALRGKHAAASS